MTYIIAYDISDDNIRSRIAKYLEGKGQRVQESVFECRKTPDDMNLIAERLNKMSDNETCIRIYPVCDECYKKAQEIGSGKEITGKKGYVIF